MTCSFIAVRETFVDPALTMTVLGLTSKPVIERTGDEPADGAVSITELLARQLTANEAKASMARFPRTEERTDLPI
jgi:hypothetical protein